MRIHQQRITRRNVPAQNDYHAYLEDIRFDFHYVCGYCGKTEQITKRGFEIDHFVPQRLDGNRKIDYTNLVYSCFTCNRKKGGKFPTEDKTKSHDGAIGIIDPASDEFEKHIERSGNGEIVGKTELGKYICKNIFKFHQRPMRQIWLAMQIVEKKQQISEAISAGRLFSEDLQLYVEIDNRLGQLQRLFFSKSE